MAAVQAHQDHGGGEERAGRVLQGLERSREGLMLLHKELTTLSESVREELVDVYLHYATALRELGRLKQARKVQMQRGKGRAGDLS